MHTLPPHDIMVQAMLQSDSSFEGIFYTAVKTTGIFCRPTCTARKPKPEHVEFFSSVDEALFAGYRPCKRCHPMDRVLQKHDLVQRLSDRIEQAPYQKISSKDLRMMNIDPSTARRQFQRAYGMTFQAYQRARRMGSALYEIREGNSVIATQVNHDFASSSGLSCQ